jgi:hypothetical protein
MTLRINMSHPHAARGLDCYWTPPEATRALMRIERLPKSVADPCVGIGAILDVLRVAEHCVFGADLVDYGWPHTVVRDFLAEPVVMNGTGIVSNPPYRLALQFVQKAIADGACFHAWLLRLNFLESMKRKSFFEAHPPSRVHVFGRRCPMMHRQGWTGKKSTSNQAMAWFVWDLRGIMDSRPQLNFLDWKE